HRTANQGSAVEWHFIGNFDSARVGNDRIRAVGCDAAEMKNIGAVDMHATAAVAHSAAERAGFTQDRPTDGAVMAVTAVWRPRHDHPVSDADQIHTRADRFDNT